MKTPTFYKFLAGALIVLLALGGGLAAVLIHNARLELDHFRKQEEDLRGQLANVQLKLQKNGEFLQRLQNDPEFLDRVARSRLGYAKPDELIFRFDVDPLTAAPVSGNTDAARPLLKTSPQPSDINPPMPQPVNTPTTRRP